MHRHWGKHRGLVDDNNDPLALGRLLVRVPGLPVMLSTWAMPCLPHKAPDAGPHILPPIGASLWVEFEEGLINNPIWTGCFRDEANAPAFQIPDD